MTDKSRGPSPLRLGPLNALLLNLWMAEKAASRRFHQDMGTRSGRYTALALIDENPGTSQKALSEAAGRDKSTLSIALADLEKDGLIRRSRSPDDKRVSALSLTPQGKARLVELQDHMAEMNAKLENIVGDRRAIFMQTLDDIIRAFDDG